MAKMNTYSSLTDIEDDDTVLGVDGGQTTVQIPISAIRGTGFNHNNFFREKDITTMFDDGTFTTNVANGSFKDIYPGNYIQKTVTIDDTSYTVKAIIVDLDYFYGGYNNSAVIAKHHAACLVLGLPSACMNPTNTTEGGYEGSEMHTTTLPKYLEALKTAFGSSCFVAHSKILTNSINPTGRDGMGGSSGCANSREWVTDQYICLPTEVQIYGSNVWSASGYDTGEGCKQFALFKNVRYNRVLGNKWFWLRNVVTSSCFACADGSGGAYSGSASDVRCVVPLILLS